MASRSNSRRQPPNGSREALPKMLMECGCVKGGRHLIVCIDGTSNKFGKKNTNVIELYNLIFKKQEFDQLTWYNSGIGTYARPSWKSLKYLMQVLGHKIDLAIAWNFERTVMGAYRWLADNYQEGDCIFLFGFSRGAFQVRVLSAMIDKVGLIYKGNEMQIPFAYELYADPKSDEPTESEVGGSRQGGTSMAERFKKAFSREGVKVHFVGAWDTVSSVGIARGQKLLPRTIDGMKHVCYFRHALALDERRVKFLPEYAYGGSTLGSQEYGSEPLPLQDSVRPEEKLSIPNEVQSDDSGAADSQDKKESVRRRQQVKEVWFPGTHSDIGGGNVDNPAMNRSRPALRWMVFEAQEAGLRTAEFQGELSSRELIQVKESLKGFWNVLEVLPIERLTFTREENGKKTTHKPHLGGSRKIHPGQKIHASLVLAARDDYTPKARPPKDAVEFWEKLDTDFREWREFDIYDAIDSTVDVFLKGSDDSVLDSVKKMASSGTGRQALYEKVVTTLSSEDVSPEVKFKFMEFSMDILKDHSSSNIPLKLAKSIQVRPHLRALTERLGTDSSGVMIKFATEFTDHHVCVLTGHKEFVCSVAFSPDGRYVASCSWDRTIRLWDTQTWQAVGEPFQGHNDSILSIAFSPDGKHIVSGSFDDTVRVWDVETCKAVGKPLEGHASAVTSVAYSPDGKLVASGSSDWTVRLWDSEKGGAVGPPLKGHGGDVNSVAFSPSGKLIASGSDDQTIRLWRIETGERVGDPFRGHRDYIFSIAFSPDEKHIISGSDDGTLRLWDVQTGQEDLPFEVHGDWVRSVAFSHDSRRVVSGSKDHTVCVWNVATREMEGPPLTGHRELVSSVVFSPDGRHVASGSWDRTIRIWDVD